MNAEFTRLDPETTQKTTSFAHTEIVPECETDDQQKEEQFRDIDNTKNVDTNQTDLHSFPRKSSNNSSALNPARNKRKNFNPRPTTIEDNNINIMNATSTPFDIVESRKILTSGDYIRSSSKSPVSPSTPTHNRGYFSKLLAGTRQSSAPGHATTHLPPWMQMISHYEQLGKVAGITYQKPMSGAATTPDVSDWARKLGNGDSAATTIRDILQGYQSRTETGILQQDENGVVNLATDTRPPTPPSGPQRTYSSKSLRNGKNDHPGHQNPAFIENDINSSSPPLLSSDNTIHTKNLSIGDKSQQLTSVKTHWNNDSDQKWNKTNCADADDDNHPEKTTNAQSYQADDNDDDSSYCVDIQPSIGEQQGHHDNIRQWCEDFPSDKRIKSECDDTENDGDYENNTYDDEDYPPASLNDYPDSPNDIEDDDNYSVNIFGGDEQSEADDHRHRMRIDYNSEGDHEIATENANAGDEEETPSLAAAEKESTCSNSSSRISVRNLAGYYELSQVKLNQSKLRSGVDEKIMHTDLIQNMNKFTSYLECLNEMCRIENLREHYHCHDYPCFGKILSKKEEVIRHVKWHRKRMESLNHGFMRFSSSDDCSKTFGTNCQHNRKQTHYHCFQPNCDKVYISTSDVQMHSNYHRKDSAIHKEGFQRFRANEKCSADYCMFSEQKTTHFHCRRDNCRYTFKNKADMEKHKAYHIKDLKLARDGFKKFLKNEECPYKQCRFSKVCNHIHCARENCFYVLHSSGQLLSHKRKHERLDNEQTYCRYKMQAVKAALLNNHSAAAGSPEIPSFDLSESLMQLRDLEMNAFDKRPSPRLEPSLSHKDGHTASMFSTEFLQQMKKRHEELLNQNYHHQTDGLQIERNSCSPNISMLSANKSSSSPQHQYNMPLEHTLRTPSVIQQFFTTKCPAQPLSDKDEPLDRNSPFQVSRNECPWKERLEPHLHCIIKGCETIIPNSVLDISAHIQMHGYNRDVYATTAVTENLLLDSSNSGNPSNTMQITTIDGFFNRKRGRPPKNRFVEVYKNAQHSPQAIFTSFKLEKQITNKEIPATKCDVSPSSVLYSSGQHLNPDSSTCTENSSSNHFPSSKQHPDFSFSPRTNPLFVTYHADEKCGVAGANCTLTMQRHYHCACNLDCSFVTVERDLLSVHLERQHTTSPFADTISKKFKRFDRNIGLDCGVFECKLRKTRPHLHCRQCYRQISPFDLESHVCAESGPKQLSSSPTKKMSSSTTLNPEYPKSEQHEIIQRSQSGNNKGFNRDYSRVPSVTFSTLNELRRKVSEMEPEPGISVTKRSHEDEKVLVVRAAGTYFPENTSDLITTSTQAQQRQSSTAESLQQSASSAMSPNFDYCATTNCKQKRRSHDHSENCDQSFVDPAKWRAHRLKHLQATNQPIPYHLAHFIEPDEPKMISDIKSPSLNEFRRQDHNRISYDDQPQDLSLSINTPNIFAPSERTILNTASYDSPSVTRALPQQPSTFSGHLTGLFPQTLVSSLSMQNIHLAQLATLYQKNPYYYQHLFPVLSNASNLYRHQQQHRPTPQPSGIQSNEDKPYISPIPQESQKSQPLSTVPPLHSAAISTKHFPYLNPLLMVRPPTMEHAKPSLPISSSTTRPLTLTSEATKSLKRKLANGNEEFSALIDALSPSTKKQMQLAAGLAAVAAAAANTSSTSDQLESSSRNEQHCQHFKIKDEQIPNGYLKFRFNEDCFFPKCGYRNHQSHFHCDRNDCHYSFCDKTRFVQHTARHERLDKLMGNDFRQFRANMSCGYEHCPYYKNLGSANKSSHFHCLKCDFICSDTNKVVAHRRQHSKMEYIRMAGFRKVTNSEKCNSTFEATVPTNGNELPGTVECSYSQKQTHYHCLVCDVSVLSRAQLGSHKHKT